jgi:uncharacterized protein (DUF2384 family)
MKQKVQDFAVQVLGSQESAAKWLNEDNPYLGNKKPNYYLNTDKGCEQIIEVLSGIEKSFLSDT